MLCRGQGQELVRVRLLHPPHAATSQRRRHLRPYRRHPLCILRRHRMIQHGRRQLCCLQDRWRVRFRSLVLVLRRRPRLRCHVLHLPRRFELQPDRPIQHRLPTSRLQWHAASMPRRRAVAVAGPVYCGGRCSCILGACILARSLPCRDAIACAAARVASCPRRHLALRAHAPACACEASHMHMHVHVHVHMHMHVRMLDVAPVCVVWTSWVAVPAIPVRVSRAWNAQVSQCICHVGLSRKWGSIPNVWSLPRSSAVRHVRARAHNMFIHMAAAEDGVWDVTAIADAPGRLMPTELG